MYTADKYKKYIRENVLLHLNECQCVLTLPNLYFNLEQKLLKNKIKVDCVEIKKDIYLQQIEIAPKEIKLFHSDIQMLDLDNYDGIFLDLCGPLTYSLYHTLSNIKVGTKVAITLLMARETKFAQHYIDISKREHSYIKLLNSYDIVVSKYINYTSTVPMCVFFCEKVNFN